MPEKGDAWIDCAHSENQQISPSDIRRFQQQLSGEAKFCIQRYDPTGQGNLACFHCYWGSDSRYIRLVSSYEQLGTSLILPRSTRYGYIDRAWMTWSAVDHMKTWPTGKWARDHQYPPHVSGPPQTCLSMMVASPARAVSCWRASSCGPGHSKRPRGRRLTLQWP